jgi:hypothetical protein
MSSSNEASCRKPPIMARPNYTPVPLAWVVQTRDSKVAKTRYGKISEPKVDLSTFLKADAFAKLPRYIQSVGSRRIAIDLVTSEVLATECETLDLCAEVGVLEDCVGYCEKGWLFGCWGC